MASLIRRNQGQNVARRDEWDPMRLMREMLGFDPFREMAPYGAAGYDAGSIAFVPQFEVKETKDGYVFKADLPGVKESDLDISLTGNRLTVSGKREAEERQEHDTWYAAERSYGSFTRSFTLPDGAGEDVHAELKDGVLTLVLPKRPELQPRKISIKASSGTTGAGGRA